MSRILTTGQIAKACSCAPRTVSKWIDAGVLKGYRMPCGSRDRRVLQEDLEAFGKQYGVHVDLEAITPRKPR